MSPVCSVPTAPPQQVEVVAINSTTIRFTWNPPPQQFINGINQGYKVSLGVCVCVCVLTTLHPDECSTLLVVLMDSLYVQDLTCNV